MDGKQDPAMHNNGEPTVLIASTSHKPSEQHEQQSETCQPTMPSSEPIVTTGSSQASDTASTSPNQLSSGNQSPVQSLRASALPLSLQDNNGGNVTLKSSTLAPELASAATVEVLISDVSDGSSEGEKSVQSAKFDNNATSASKALEKIIRHSVSASSVSSKGIESRQPISGNVNTTETADQMETANSTTTTPQLPTAAPAPYIGTVLEGHAFPASTSPSPSLSPAPADDTSNPRPLTAKPKAATQRSKDETASQRSSLSILTGWWSGSGASSTTVLATTYSIQDKDPSETATQHLTEDNQQSSDSPTQPDTTDDTMGPRESVEWEPSGLEKDALERIRATKDGQNTSSLASHPNSQPSNVTSPLSLSLIKASGKAATLKERRDSTSSSYSHSRSSWWGRWSASSDSNNNSSNDKTNDTIDYQVQYTAVTSHLSSVANVIIASELDMEQLEGEESSTAPSSFGESTQSAAREGGLMIASTSGSEHQQKQGTKRWTIFGLGGGAAKDNNSYSSKGDATPTDDSTTLASGYTSGTTVIKTSVAVPNTDVEASTQDSQDGEAAPTAPALVSTTEVDVTVQVGESTADKEDTRKKNESTALVPASSSYSGWLSVIPGFGSKATDDTQAQRRAMEEASLSHQITDYEEGERRDIHGNVIKFKQQPDEDSDSTSPTTTTTSKTRKTKTLAQVAEEKRDSKVSMAESSPTLSSASSDRQTLSELKEKESKKESLAKEVAGKAAATLSKMIKPKNMVLPAYYDQFPDARECLLTVPIGPSEIPVAEASKSGHDCRSSIMSSAVNVLSSILFPRVTKAEQEAKAKAKAEARAKAQAGQHPLPRGPGSVRKVVIFGIHGWFPTKLVRTVIGEPTGTSKKFCDEMDLALKDYLKANKLDLPEENITLIPLEGEGKVLDRVEILYQSLMKNSTWRKALHDADLVLVATHSQGTPTSILLLSRLIEEGLVRVKEGDPMMQQVGMLAMAGISHGPFPFLKGNLIVRWVEAEAASELFEFMDSETDIAKRYWQAIRKVLTSGVRLTCVASLEDQVVPMYSAVMTSISHPSIVRAVYIDGVSYQDDFLTNLISFSLRLRNAGIDDHGVLVHLSEVVAGSIYGEGHSTIYDERDVYLLAIRALLEPPSRLTQEKARCEPVMIPFKARQRLNPFYLPWGMRGIMEEIMRLGDEALTKEFERLQQLYDKWTPTTKGMKEIKFRLEPVRSKL
ncbi:hypothetical protein BGW42_000558 [Actinomortierella wolfii]|nr:hypothetical protein BGW42_000558 [Actinomortierella wolfii]